MQRESMEFDVVIVGAGPSGLAAAIKLKQLAQQNKQRERSLERMLELTKRFYVEQKAMQIANKLKDLSNKQEKLSLSETPEIEKQKDISKTFTLLKKELSTLSKDNEKLKESMELPNLDSDKEKIDNSLKSAEQSLSTKEAKKAKMQPNPILAIKKEGINISIRKNTIAAIIQ